MTRQKDVDWSDWKGYVEPQVHPLSKPLKKNIKNGADAVRDALTKGELPVAQEAPRQPTDQEMFGHLVVTEEMIKAKEEQWKNAIKNSLIGARKPVDHLNKSKIDDRKWESGKSFNSLLTKEELEERNKFTSEE